MLSQFKTIVVNNLCTPANISYHSKLVAALVDRMLQNFVKSSIANEHTKDILIKELGGMETIDKTLSGLIPNFILRMSSLQDKLIWAVGWEVGKDVARFIPLADDNGSRR